MTAALLPERFTDATLLGTGAQGRTWRAFDTVGQREVAVKVLRLREEEGWKGFELFERECAVLRTMDHPGVPDYYDHVADEDTGTYYLVMELVHGESLATALAQGRRRTEAALLQLLQALLTTLDYLQSLRPPVIHRDIKPGNIIVDKDGQPVLVDFGGVAHALRSKGGSTMIGTFGYMAPEQLYARATPATDLYALGATIAALAGGVEAEELPRDGMEIDVAALVSDGPLRRALRVMLRADASTRAQSVAEVRDAMKEPPAPLARVQAVALARTEAPQDDPRALARGSRAGRLMHGLSPKQRRAFGSSVAVVATLSATMAGPATALVLTALTIVGWVFAAGIARGYSDAAD